MESANFIPSFSCRGFMESVSSPLCVCFVDGDVDNIFLQNGIKFSTFLGAISSKMSSHMRVIDILDLQEQKQETFFDGIPKNVQNFGDAFSWEKFEESGQVDTTNVPQGYGMPQKLQFLSKDAMNPPWYKRFLIDLINSMHFSEFWFYDLPLCVLYITTPDTKALSAKSIPQMLPLPTWMLEFFKGVPVVNLIVYDKSNSAKAPNIAENDFNLTFTIGISAKGTTHKTEETKRIIKEIFMQNPEIADKIIEAGLIDKDDITEAKNIISKVMNDVVFPAVNKKIKKLTHSIEKSKRMKNVLKGIFKKKEPEPVTSILSIPLRKLAYLQLAYLQVITLNYVEAEKNFKAFYSMTDEPQLGKVRLCALFNAVICNFIWNSVEENNEDYIELMAHIEESNSPRFILTMPLLCAEFFATTGKHEEALKIILRVTGMVVNLMKGSATTKNAMIALLYDRAAGVAKDRRHMLFYYASACNMYESASQYGHALRCAIWLKPQLPEKSWPLLYQGVVLKKSTNLLLLNENLRSFNDCKDLLELSNLQVELQQDLISQFWRPFNDPNFDITKYDMQLSTLLTVDSTSTIGQSDPQYWGYDPTEFSCILEEYKEFVKNEEIKNAKGAMSFHCWISEKGKEEEKPIKVPTGTKLNVLINVNNRYTFTIFLNSARIIASYEGKSTKKDLYYAETISDTCVIDKSQLKFEFTPYEPGIYTINRLNKNYWGYLDTEIEIPPIRIEASQQASRLKISVDGLPSTALQGMCLRFKVLIKNDSNYPTDDIVVGFDNPDSIAYEGNVEHQKNIAIIKLKDKLEAHSEISIPLIFRAARMNINKVHFFVASQNAICCYSEVVVSVSSVGTVSATVIQNTNDTGNKLFKVKFTSNIDGLSIIGISNNKGKLLKTLKSHTPQIIDKGAFSTIIAFSDQKEDTKTLEPWRIFMMSGSAYSILYKAKGWELNGQQNLRIEYEPEKRFTMSMPNKATIKKGSRIKVVIKEYDTEDIFIQPMPLELTNDERNMHRNILAARWVGKTRKKLSKENGYETEFFFIVLEPGIFIVPGFLYSSNIDFSDVHEVQLKHSIHIFPE